MPTSNKTILDFLPKSDGANLALGTLEEIVEGRPIVKLAGQNQTGFAVSAIETAWEHISQKGEALFGSPVILALVEDQYILLGFVHPEAPIIDNQLRESTPDSVRDKVIHGERLILDANRELVLKCGGSEITLRKDGKVVIKGAKLISRSSGQNKIRGATVNIN